MFHKYMIFLWALIAFSFYSYNATEFCEQFVSINWPWSNAEAELHCHSLCAPVRWPPVHQYSTLQVHTVCRRSFSYAELKGDVCPFPCLIARFSNISHSDLPYSHCFNEITIFTNSIIQLIISIFFSVMEISTHVFMLLAHFSAY